MAFNTAYDLDSLMVATKAATVYTAQENSLFLGGGLIPQVNLPAGSVAAQIPVMGSVTANKLTSSGVAGTGSDFNTNGNDFDALGITDTKVTITANIYAARDVVRDLGGIDPAELGRVLGNAVAARFDADVIAAMNSLTASTGDSDPVTVDSIFNAVAQIRGAGEMGQLFGIISPAQTAALMKAIGAAAYAGGDFQTEALRNGFVGSVGGVRLFQSAYVSGTNKGFIFSPDALRIAMFKNVDLEVQRRAAAVGNDIVASLHAGVGVIDATRGIKLVNV
jgi:hypothetical protein